MSDQTDSTVLTWEDKAHQIIARLALQAYQDAGNSLPVNPRKRHKPYTLPALAVRLNQCLNTHDRAEAEQTAKRLFIDYAGGLPADSPLIAID